MQKRVSVRCVSRILLRRYLVTTMRDDVCVHQGQKVPVENSNTFTINAIGREAAGEYKCSLAGNEEMEASRDIVVNCE